MIPADKSPAVARALQAAFDVTTYESITQLTAGLSTALVFRIIVKSRPYLLRIITSREPIADPTRQFCCMQSAADAGLAPRVWYASIEDRLSITDFVDARRFPLSEALARLPNTLKELHALPLFPKVIDFIDFVDRSIARFRAASILPESETAELFRLYANVPRIYPRDEAGLVSSHNDLKPENILFDGTKVWIVDWEAAFRNDEYFDLAVVANFIVSNEDEEEALLRSYFGEPAGEYRAARFQLMRKVVNMSYAMTFTFLGSSGKPIGPAAQIPDFRAFHHAIWSGEINMVSNEKRLLYGRVHMAQLLRDLQSGQFQEALSIVSDHHPASSV